MNISKHIRIPLLILSLVFVGGITLHTLRAEATGYTPVAINSPINTSLKVTATPLELNNTTNLWSYKIDWKRTRNAQGSISIAEESSPTTKVLSLSPASQEGSQTVTLKPSTTYRVKFYPTAGYAGTAILSKKLTTLSIDDEQPDIDTTNVQARPTNTLQTQINELLAIIARLRAQLDELKPLTPLPLPTTTPPRIEPPQPVACTMEARLCPDGVTYVGRTGPQCEFAPCPPKKCDTGLLYMPSCSGVPVQDPNTCEVTCPVPPVTPVPPSPPSNVNNTVSISNKSNMALTNYPMQIGRPFKQGEIMQYPQVLLNGSALPTQADIKNRWPDGSVKFAILSFIIPTIPASSPITVSFSNQSSSNNTALTQSQMLGTSFNFDAQIKLTSNGSTKTVSARDMLAAGDYTVWTSGPIATTIILTDHSVNRKYDTGFDSYKSFRPIFEATFWPATNQVRVRYIGENSNTKSLQDIQYDLGLSLGLSNPQSVYDRAGLVHPMMTRWTKVFWLNKTPEQKINIDNNLAYLEQTTYFPAYDTLVQVPESTIANSYSKWLSYPRDLYQSGGWTKYMPTTGGRYDVGPFTAWTMYWLYSGDWRSREVALGMGDLAGSWRLHIREGDVTKNINKAQTTTGVGLPISVYAYPNLWLPDNNGSYKQLAISDPTIITDAKEYPTTGYGWIPDNAHQPDPFFAQYVLTGDHWYMEESQLWASASALSVCSGNATWCRGPKMAGVYEQVRGEAWMFRNRVNALLVTPDDSPVLKDFYGQLVDDAIAFWEGKIGITGTKFQDTAEWKWSNSNNLLTPNPLHLWARGSISTWQHYYLLTILGMAKEKGVAVGPLFNFLSAVLTEQVSASNYNPYNIASYWIDTADKNGVPYSSWGQLQTANIASGNMKATGDFSVTSAGSYYAILAATASSFMTSVPNGLQTWNFLNTNVRKASLSNSSTVPGWFKGYYDGTGEINWNILPR